VEKTIQIFNNIKKRIKTNKAINSKQVNKKQTNEQHKPEVVVCFLELSSMSFGLFVSKESEGEGEGAL
jgi:hypothetical protein